MNKIIETQDGFDILIGGRRYGTWRSRAEAIAGLRIEQQRRTNNGNKTPDMTHTCRGKGCKYPDCENNT